MSEQAIQRGILKYLKSLPDCWVVKTVTCNINGVPDILVCYKGQFIAFEVKTPTGRVSPIQTYQIEQIEAAGGRAFVVRGLPEVQALLREL